MYYGFSGLCADFLSKNPGYSIVPVRISGSAIESVFSCLQYISGGNLSAINYATSLSTLVTQRESSSNSKGERDYRNLPITIL
jgi:phospholipid N-methyltransferase